MNKHEQIPDSEKNEVSPNGENQTTAKPMDALAYIQSLTCPIAKSFMLIPSPEY